MKHMHCDCTEANLGGGDPGLTFAVFFWQYFCGHDIASRFKDSPSTFFFFFKEREFVFVEFVFVFIKEREFVEAGSDKGGCA